MGLTSNRIRSERGFTLIELLVVILIIGILAAIALPAFLGQRAKSHDSAAKSDARNMLSQMETCFVGPQDYTNCTSNTPGQIVNTNLPIDSAMPPGSGSVAARADTSTYTIVSQSRSGNFFSIEKDSTGLITRTCTTSGEGGCLDTGTW